MPCIHKATGQGESPREPPHALRAWEDGRMRNRIVRVRVTDDEVARIRDLARARGLSASEMVRRASLGVRMPARSFDQTHAELLARTLGELGRIGGNLNQAIRRANAGKLTGHDAELSKTIDGIDALRQRIRSLLS